jgi:hypothetical protein
MYVSLTPVQLNELTSSPQQNEDSKIILANAAQHVGQSVKIWLAASDLEHDAKAKKRVLRRGATFSTSSPPFHAHIVT